MQRALAAAVAQPPPSRFGRGLGGLGRRGGLWLLICSILVAAAAVALVLLTGFGQHSGSSPPRPTSSTAAGVPSSPAALHQPARSGADRAGLTHAAAAGAAQAATGVGGGVQSAGHAAVQPTAGSTPSAHAQAPAANTNPKPKATSKGTPVP
jgi:hypothetical protein